jgi:hypothetical protein
VRSVIALPSSLTLSIFTYIPNLYYFTVNFERFSKDSLLIADLEHI